MEKEAGIPKPGDLFIGVVDLFAVLVPGLIAAVLIIRVSGFDLKPDVVSLSGLLIAGWVLGHVLHGIGSWLDHVVYDRLFWPKKDQPTKHRGAIKFAYFRKNEQLYKLARASVQLPPNGNEPAINAEGVPGGMYQWARAWLNSHHPHSASSVERLEADSKLFRSLAVLLIIAIPMFAIYCIENSSDQNASRNLVVLAGLVLFGLPFSLWRYCDLRSKMIRQCYLNYVQLQFESRDRLAGSKETGKSTELN